MRYDEKIEVMLANGVLTAEQAATLRRSLGTGHSAGASLHGRLPLKKIALAAVAVALAFGIYAMWPSASILATNEIQNVAETMNLPGKVGEMNKSAATLISSALIGLPVLLSLIWFALGYNGLVTKEEDILVAWAQVETNYQRRADLIPNLVKAVRTFAEHEKATLTGIAGLRSKLDTLDAESQKVKSLSEGAAARLADEAFMENLAKAQTTLSGQVKGLMVSVEAYPTLTSSDQFLQLQAELAGTENRVGVARMAFNEKVGAFNSAIRKLPGSLVASAGNFQRKAYFKADEGSESAVKVFE